MEDGSRVATALIAARVAQPVVMELLKRGARMREAGDLAELVVAIRWLRRTTPGLKNTEIADWLETSPATFYRRRDRFIELTSIEPEKYPVELAPLLSQPAPAIAGVRVA